MRIIDTHLHLAYRPRFSQPWMAAYPAIDRSWKAEDYFVEALPLGIEAALHMENDVSPEQMLGEAAFMCTAHERIVGAIAAARPESTDFPEQLEILAAMPHVRGIRRILHVMPDALSDTPLFVDNVRRLAGAGLSFELCVRADQLAVANKLAAAAPDVQFILDHCGNPDIANDGFSAWSPGLQALASLPNVAAKLSGLAVNAAPGWSAETLRPYVEHLIAAFGWDRVVWGSDHPVLLLNGSLQRWVAACHDLTAGVSEDERAKLFHANAERIYRLGDRP
ncbi:MAG: amidohydrolase [Pelagibacterium sp. SCN 63-23]|nr:MAG: amidohydrolase [Pelagibacterium sp. SCN 63-23]